MATRKPALTVPGKVRLAVKRQPDSTHSPIAGPAWMSSPPAAIRNALIAVSKNE